MLICSFVDSPFLRLSVSHSLFFALCGCVAQETSVSDDGVLTRVHASRLQRDTTSCFGTHPSVPKAALVAEPTKHTVRTSATPHRVGTGCCAIRCACRGANVLASSWTQLMCIYVYLCVCVWPCSWPIASTLMHSATCKSRVDTARSA